MSDFIAGVLSRENEIIRLIKLLFDSKLDFIVVGGYAVSVHKKRFSIDLDIVIKEADVNKFESVLEKEGFSGEYSKEISTVYGEKFESVLEKEGFSGEYSKEISTVYGEKFERLEKKIGKLTVSVDLLINGVVSRVKGGSWSYELLLENSAKSVLQGAEFLAP